MSEVQRLQREILRVEQIAMMLFGAGPLFWILWKQERK